MKKQYQQRRAGHPKLTRVCAGGAICLPRCSGPDTTARDRRKVEAVEASGNPRAATVICGDISLPDKLQCSRDVLSELVLDAYSISAFQK